MTTASAGARSKSWSSSLAVYLATAGAAVGLGSIWRFPYLAGTGGGSAFIFVFVLACLLIATPLLAAELALGRRSRRSPPEAAGAVAVAAGLSRHWNAIGILGSLAGFVGFSYYTVIAGWVFAYGWKCAAGLVTAAGPARVAGLWHAFRADSLEVGAWHAAFVLIVMVISARGLQRGIEAANAVRGPALLSILVLLAGYALVTGDVARGMTFAFAPHFGALDAKVALAAIGQAFYATGVGQAMMIAYGAYAERGTSLIRTSVVITAAILVVSLLATVAIFPLVFRYGMNPAQGTQLVFEVLPRVFAEIPGGRVIGALFFALLVLAALMPSIALLEPTVAWLIERLRIPRPAAVIAAGVAAWFLGLGSVLSFGRWSSWHPLGLLPSFADKTFFDIMDYVMANVMLPLGALLTSLLIGWRLERSFIDQELVESNAAARNICRWLLRWVCPLAIAAIAVANFL